VALPPVYAANSSGTSAIQLFNQFSSRDFDLPASYESEVVNEIAQMIGLNLRDNDIQQYAQAKTTAE
jgi:hypothetical protein